MVRPLAENVVDFRYLLADVTKSGHDDNMLRRGYDVATRKSLEFFAVREVLKVSNTVAVASIGLTALVGPRAFRTGEAYSTVLATLGGVSSVGNLLKSYQVRTGKPKDMHISPSGQQRTAI